MPTNQQGKFGSSHKIQLKTTGAQGISEPQHDRILCQRLRYLQVGRLHVLRYNTEVAEGERQECHVWLDKINRYKHSSLFELGEQ